MNDNLDNSALLCIRCSYALQGLDAAADCPECGLAIEASLRGARFAFSPEKPRRVVRCLWFIAALDVAVLMLALPMCGFAVTAPSANTNWLPLGVVAAASLLRGGMVNILRLVTRKQWRYGDPVPGRFLILAVSCRAILAVATVCVVLVGGGNPPFDVAVAVLVAWGGLGLVEGWERKSWMMAVSSALGAPSSARTQTLAQTASGAIWVILASAAILVGGSLLALSVVLVLVPVVVVAVVVLWMSLLGGTIGCADVVSEWHAARVEP